MRTNGNSRKEPMKSLSKTTNQLQPRENARCQSNDWCLTLDLIGEEDGASFLDQSQRIFMQSKGSLGFICWTLNWKLLLTFSLI